MTQAIESPATPPETLLTKTQVGAAFGVCERTIWRWSVEGKIRTVKVPGGIRIPASEVDRLRRGES